jgi:hypothetical protein
MGRADLALLLRKIVVGVVITVAPLLILVGGLWLVRTILTR